STDGSCRSAAWAFPPRHRRCDATIHDPDALRAQPLGVLGLVAGDEPAGRVDHPVPGQGAVAVGHHPPDRPRRLGLADPLGHAAVAGHRPGRDPPHHPLDAALEGRHRPHDPEADREPLAVQSAAHQRDGIRAVPRRARTERHYTGGSGRLLLIAFDFPPAGVGGVQRTLNFCRDLPDVGFAVDVLAPSDPKWFALDEPLLEAIPTRTPVHRERFLGPRSSFRGEALRGARGLRRAAVDARYAYERALIPDKAVPWGAMAVPAAVRIVRRRRIDAIMTTSPPPSVHLIGAAVAAATSTPWVADLRDSWLAHPHREYERRGVRAKRAVERRMARMVAHRATALVAVTDAIAAELAGLDAGAAAKTHVIGHGVDLSDFAGLDHAPPDRFTIVHTGAFFGQRTPRPFLTAVRDLLERRPELRGQVLVRFVGDMREADLAWARGLGIDGAWEETGFLPYRD